MGVPQMSSPPSRLVHAEARPPVSTLIEQFLGDVRGLHHLDVAAAETALVRGDLIIPSDLVHARG